jgi:hypothetical protein
LPAPVAGAGVDLAILETDWAVLRLRQWLGETIAITYRLDRQVYLGKTIAEIAAEGCHHSSRSTGGSGA